MQMYDVLHVRCKHKRLQIDIKDLKILIAEHEINLLKHSIKTKSIQFLTLNSRL